MALEALQPNVEPFDPKLGYKDEVRQKTVEHLNDVLSDMYTLLIKTQVYHWNVVGPLFYSVHKLTEEQYNAIFLSIDEVAERIRSLGGVTLMNAANMIDKTPIKEEPGPRPSAGDMLKNLVDDHRIISARLGPIIEYTDENGDSVTADMLTEKREFHDEAAWMLGALATE